MSFGVALRKSVSIGLGGIATLASGTRGFNPSLNLNFTSGVLDPRITFTRATTATFTGSNGLIQTAAINAPRFDYNPITLESLGLLIEEQRTNLLTYSEQFDNAAWTKTASTISANTIVAPDGTLTGDKIIADSGATISISAANVTAYQSVSKAATATTYSFSYYAKAGEFNAARLFVRDTATSANNSNATVSLIDGSVLVAAVSAGTFTAASVSAGTSVGNGWYRFTLTFTSGTETSLRILVVPSNSSATTGNGSNGIYIWGAQFEAGAFSTSYIPTVASQVTRSADSAVMTGTNFSSWFNPAEGTLTCEASTPSFAVIYVFADINSNSLTNYIRQSTSSAGTTSQFILTNLGTTVANPGVVVTLGSNRKTAGAYALNNVQQSVNGALGVEDVSAIVPSGMSQMNIGSRSTGGSAVNSTIKRISYYPLRLPNSQLQALTA